MRGDWRLSRSDRIARNLLWLMVLVIAVIGGAAGGFRFFLCEMSGEGYTFRNCDIFSRCKRKKLPHT